MQKNKLCPKCDRCLPLEQFNKQASRSDGLQVYCKACLKQYRDGRKEHKAAIDKAYRSTHAGELKLRKQAYFQANKETIKIKRRDYIDRNREKVAATLANYRVNNPEKIKAIRKANYWKAPEQNRLSVKQWVDQNKDRVREYKLGYRMANLFSIRQKAREFIKANHDRLKFVYKANKAKRRAAGKKVSPSEIQTILKSQQYKCVACRVNIRSHFHLDHILPIALGGTNERTNLQCLCQTCNLSKSKKHPIDFMQQRGFLL